MGSKAKQATTPYDANVNKSIEAVATPAPLEKSLSKQTQSFLDWENGEGASAGKPRNVLDAPGLRDTYDIYGNANRLADEQRMGNGALAFIDSANGAYGAQLKQLGDQQRYDSRAQGLSGALHDMRNQAHAEAGDLINTDATRKAQTASLYTGQQAAYWNRPQKPSLLGQILGGATQVGAGLASGGFFNGKTI